MKAKRLDLRGTAPATMKVWRSYTVPLTETSEENIYSQVDETLTFLSRELNLLLANRVFMDLCQKNLHLVRGDFWNEVTRASHKPYLDWKLKGSRAKYWRMLLERVRVTLLSFEERFRVAEVCDQYNWDIKQWSGIRKELEAKKLYPTAGTLRNLLRARTTPTIPTELPFFLDYSLGDKQVIRVLGELHYAIYLQGEWLELKLPAPSHLRGNEREYAKPLFRRILDSSGKQIIMVQVAYKANVQELPGNPEGVLGVDLGKIKPFSASVVYPNQSYTAELLPSRELAVLSRKIDQHGTELARIWRKRKALEALCTGQPDPNMSSKIARLERQSMLVSRRRSLAKQHASRLIARDVVAHAVKEKACKINLEDLRWLDSKGGKWDHAQSQRCIRELAELHGLEAVVVSATKSSQTDPFTDTPAIEKSNRKLELADGSRWDRDRTAGIELARRPRQKRAKSAKPEEKLPVRKKACRDKHSSTPKRPPTLSRRKRRIVLKKKVETSLVVAFSDECRPSNGQLVVDSNQDQSDKTITTYAKVIQL